MTDGTLDSLTGGHPARVREVSVMVPKDGTLPDRKLLEIHKAVADYIKARGYSQGLVAQKLGSNETYVSNFLSGNFAAIPAKTLQEFARAVNEWMAFDNARRVRTGTKVFVHTKVAYRLIKVARHAVETTDIAVAHGPGGCGKSATLEQLRTLIPASIYIYITPQRGKPGGFLQALYQAVWQHRAPKRPTLDDVIDRLKHSDRLLMLDNADLIQPDVFPTLMALYDVAQIPILIVGTHKVLEKLTHDADPLRGQMSSRIGLRAELLPEVTAPRRSGRGKEWIPAAQIREMFGRDIKLHPAAVARLESVANFEIGHLRRCERYLRYARLIAAKRRCAQITADILDAAIELVDAERPVPLPTQDVAFHRATSS